MRPRYRKAGETPAVEFSRIMRATASASQFLTDSGSGVLGSNFGRLGLSKIIFIVQLGVKA